jgi:hypothetical protein
MIGDDLESDVLGAQAVGIRGVLLRTGESRPSDEAVGRPLADAQGDDFSAAPRRCSNSPGSWLQAASGTRKSRLMPPPRSPTRARNCVR